MNHHHLPPPPAPIGKSCFHCSIFPRTVYPSLLLLLSTGGYLFVPLSVFTHFSASLWVILNGPTPRTVNETEFPQDQGFVLVWVLCLPRISRGTPALEGETLCRSLGHMLSAGDDNERRGESFASLLHSLSVCDCVGSLFGRQKGRKINFICM